MWGVPLRSERTARGRSCCQQEGARKVPGKALRPACGNGNKTWKNMYNQEAAWQVKLAGTCKEGVRGQPPPDSRFKCNYLLQMKESWRN